jgi:hypothetical protein
VHQFRHDRRRGLIIPKRPAPGVVTIKPKGLLPAETYTVSFHESGANESRSGADLMERGIRLEKMLPGELVYLNLPLHPGSKLDKETPGAPSDVQKRPAEMVDTYSADDIWGVCVYRKEFPAPGRHSLRITVLGQHSPRAKGSQVVVDGFRIEP